MLHSANWTSVFYRPTKEFEGAQLAQSILESPTEKLLQKYKGKQEWTKKKQKGEWNRLNYSAIRISEIVKDNANLIWKGKEVAVARWRLYSI